MLIFSPHLSMKNVKIIPIEFDKNQYFSFTSSKDVNTHQKQKEVEPPRNISNTENSGSTLAPHQNTPINQALVIRYPSYLYWTHRHLQTTTIFPDQMAYR